MMSDLFIGLCGKKGSGKSYVAENMRDLRGAKITRFADTLKDMMRVMGFNEGQINGNLKEVACDMLNGKTPRYAMQTLGTEWGRNLLHENIWVDMLVAKANKETGIVVVDDVRFPNEIKAIRENGGVVAWVERVSVYEGDDEHASETSVSAADCDVWIDNTLPISEVLTNVEGWARLQKDIRNKNEK
jgi:hypothetical protein